MTNKVTILRGIPGSGKSTHAAALNMESADRTFIVSADHFFEGEDGMYRFDRTKLGMAHSQCLRRFVRALQDDVPYVIVDNTNITAIEVAPYAQLAIAYGYKVEIVTLIEHWLKAHERNVHGVPLKTVGRHAERLAEEARYFPSYWKHTEIDKRLKVF